METLKAVFFWSEQCACAAQVAGLYKDRILRPELVQLKTTIKCIYEGVLVAYLWKEADPEKHEKFTQSKFDIFFWLLQRNCGQNEENKFLFFLHKHGLQVCVFPGQKRGCMSHEALLGARTHFIGRKLPLQLLWQPKHIAQTKLDFAFAFNYLSKKA